MTFAIISMFELEAESAVFARVVQPRTFDQPDRARFALSTDHKKDRAVALYIEPGVVGLITL